MTFDVRFFASAFNTLYPDPVTEIPFWDDKTLADSRPKACLTS